MLRLKDADKVVGTRRLTKAIEQGQIKLAYVAQDADLFITRQIDTLCKQHNVPLVEVPSMKALGEACAVEVPTAAAGIKKPAQ
ncbi:ribosomal L7Ae/L30e/S12e/Gadd45 family protein [Eubacteriales bacterium OttesenSCG-928-N13]|nr:ribosomal L7Ae/L30e/S12e/Gadd45 family protein [Eubacteriales bacterium OttesenSCG-928-N13]